MFKYYRKVGGVEGGWVMTVGSMEVSVSISGWGWGLKLDDTTCKVPRVFNGEGSLSTLVVHAFKENGGEWITCQAGSKDGKFYRSELCAKTEGNPGRRLHFDKFEELYNEALKRTLEEVIKEL